jgi:Na+/melibiose symporter-like transporter
MARTPVRSSAPAPDSGWRRFQPGDGGGTSLPFARFARAHALLGAGDALVALALAGSLFFSISPDAARTRVALYLLVTMAPFAVVAPLIGPLLDRRKGGRRGMVFASAGIRAVVCAVMVGHLDSLWLFPEAFALLVLAKGYGVARASLVPRLVHDETELVEANSKLSIITGVMGFVAAVPGVALLQLGAAWVLALASVTFGVATIAAFQVPRDAIEPAPPKSDVEKAELRALGVVLAASTMAMLRATVGFLAFFLAFWLRDDDAPSWWFGVALASSAVGALAGAGVAPALRRVVREERILLGCTAAVAVGALGAAQLGGRPGVAVLAAVVGLAASAGRLAFDSIVQRDAPDADQGRSFAGFETRFQLAWVAGAFVPVAIPTPLGAGFLAIGAASAAAAVAYGTGRRLTARPLVRRLRRSTSSTPES